MMLKNLRMSTYVGGEAEPLRLTEPCLAAIKSLSGEFQTI